MLPLIAIHGPTASGKSAVAVEAASALIDAHQPVEIINADSMLVYRGMDIGTAKPTVTERHGVPHHLIDIMDVTDTASVADFQVLARGQIADCRARGVVPFLVGGSSLYLRAILDEFEFPGTDSRIRARLEEELVDKGSAVMYEKLRQVAPEAAAGILPGNARRIIRALEVIELTGSFTSTLPVNRYALAGVHQIGLDVERCVLDDRIARRVEQMWHAGFIAEVQSLIPRGLRNGKTASRALGYRQILAFLDGLISEDEALAQTVVRTRQFARKQLGWFRRDPRIVWTHAGTDEAVGLITSLVDRAIG